MTDLLSLYRQAELDNIDVYWFTMESTESLSIMDSDGSCAIAMDPWYLHTQAEEKTKLAHEMGHCETGSFYNKYASLDVRKKHENQADKWAIEHLIPKEEFEAAREGGLDIQEMAERFGVTIGFMKKAACWHMYGNLSRRTSIFKLVTTKIK